MADIVRATYYITDAKDADAVFAVCGEKLGESARPRRCSSSPGSTSPR